MISWIIRFLPRVPRSGDLTVFSMQQKHGIAFDSQPHYCSLGTPSFWQRETGGFNFPTPTFMRAIFYLEVGYGVDLYDHSLIVRIQDRNPTKVDRQKHPYRIKIYIAENDNSAKRILLDR